MMNLKKTLEELDGEDWGVPTYDSHLVQTTFVLRKKPLKDFTIEDLRIMINQNFDLEYLMPLAIERLQENILADGDFYPGDLLKSVLMANTDFWVNNKNDYKTVKGLYQNKKEFIESRVGIFEWPSINKEILNDLEKSFNCFNELNVC